MQKNNKKKGDFWKTLKFNYRVSALNENTLEEVWRIRTSILKGMFLVLFGALFLIAITSVIIITTPIRYYLPGYMDVEIRDKAAKTAIKIDSLERVQMLNNQYIENLRLIMEGELPADYATKEHTSDIVSENDPRLAKSKLEADFTSKYEDKEKYTLNVFPETESNTNKIFFSKPVNGVINDRHNALLGQNGISFNVIKTEPVIASSNGTITYIGYEPDSKKNIQIQHKNGYLSIYKGITETTKKVGDEVKAGEAIGIIRVDDKEKNQKLTYELWNKGEPLDPELFILF